jgi:hypothetical protein
MGIGALGLVACLAVAPFAACQSPPRQAAVPTMGTVEPVARASPTAVAVAKALTADTILARLHSSGLPVAGAVAHTAASDPNRLLGRPD